AVGRVPLRGGAQRGQRFHPGRVQGRAGVGGDEHTVPQGEPEPSRHTGAGGGVGGVLRELDDETVAVTAEDEVLLGVRVLPEPGGTGGPGVQNTPPQLHRAERIGPLGGGPHELAHVDSPHRVTTKVPRAGCPAFPATPLVRRGPRPASRTGRRPAAPVPPGRAGAARAEPRADRLPRDRRPTPHPRAARIRPSVTSGTGPRCRTTRNSGEAPHPKSDI